MFNLDPSSSTYWPRPPGACCSAKISAGRRLTATPVPAWGHFACHRACRPR